MMTSKIAMNEVHIRQAFDRLDVDKSGAITVDNLKQVLGEQYQGEDIEKLLAEADLSATGSVDFEEFMVYMQGDSASEAQQEAIIKLIDKEKSIKSKYSASGTNLGAATVDAAPGTAPPTGTAEAPAAAATAPAAAGAAQESAAPAPPQQVQQGASAKGASAEASASPATPLLQGQQGTEGQGGGAATESSGGQSKSSCCILQ
jgi:hypothetical protein